MQSLSLFNTPVRIDDEGMVCLTDMWKIAKDRVKSGDNKFLAGRDIDNLRPYKFVRLESTQLFINELSKWDFKTHLRTERGKHGGTFGSRFVAYEFAGHIDPAFKVGVYNVLDKFFSGDIVALAGLMANANMIDHIIKEEASHISGCARDMNHWGLGGRKRKLLEKREQAYAQLQIKIPGLPA